MTFVPFSVWQHLVWWPGLCFGEASADAQMQCGGRKPFIGYLGIFHHWHSASYGGVTWYHFDTWNCLGIRKYWVKIIFPINIGLNIPNKYFIFGNIGIIWCLGLLQWRIMGIPMAFWGSWVPHLETSPLRDWKCLVHMFLRHVFEKQPSKRTADGHIQMKYPLVI